MGKYKVTLSEKAIDDLVDISAYISKELLDQPAAEKLVEKFQESIESLSHMPKRHTLLQDKELATMGVRRILIDNYIVFYICLDKDMSVSVVRVLYSKRDWKHLI